MKNYKAQQGSEPHIIECLKVRLRTDGMNGGTEFDTVVARNIAVKIAYTYSPGLVEEGEEVTARSVKIKEIRTTAPAWFDSESGAVLSFAVGSCIHHIIDEKEIEAMEEELLKKLEAQ